MMFIYLSVTCFVCYTCYILTSWFKTYFFISQWNKCIPPCNELYLVLNSLFLPASSKAEAGLGNAFSVRLSIPARQYLLGVICNSTTVFNQYYSNFAQCLYTCIGYSTIETKEAGRIGYNRFLFPHEYSSEGRGA